MARYLNQRTLLTAVTVLLLAIFLPPLINVNRFRPQIAGALSRALGRPVSVGSISLRLFPRPGLGLERLVVQDDPAFSAEPLLQSPQVRASLRLTSLWRGRLEIARLSLSYPSLNLVRAPNGKWNLESLLEHARQVPVAPTTKLRPESRLRFPYVEADGGRINLKIGPEKKVYALSDADFALWLERENEWHLRLAARPMRTDANLSDTGVVKLSGTVQRGSTLSDTPLDLQVVLDGAQLGQLTTLIYGRDRGWRGTVNLSARLRGTPADMKLAGVASIGDFRRYDIGTSGALRLATRCTAGFSTITQQLSPIDCRSAVGEGAIEVHGESRGVPPKSYALTVTVRDLPASSLAPLALRMKKDLPQDLRVAGTVAAVFSLRKQAAATPPLWAGLGNTTLLEIRSGSMNQPLQVGTVQFVLGVPPQSGRAGRRNSDLPAATLLRIDPFPLDLDAAAPARAQAWFSGSQYHISLHGDAQVRRLLELALAAGVHAPQPTAIGLAKVDLSIAGPWAGFALPEVTGTAQLRTTTVPLPGFAAPLQIAVAHLTLSSDSISVHNLSASFPKTRLAFAGSLRLPRSCGVGDACPAQFQLAADQLSIDDLNLLLNPQLQKRPWYDLITASRPQPPFLGHLTAQGALNAARVTVGGLVATRVSGSVQLERGVLSISSLRADVLGGSHDGELTADFTGAQPVYNLRGTLDRGSVTNLAALTRDNWGAGIATATYQARASGWNASDLNESATGTISFDWRDGSLAHLTLDGATPPLRFRQFRGQAKLAAGQLTFEASKMETSAGIYTVTGTASLDRELELRLMRSKAQGFDIDGTLEKPRVKVVSLPRTEAKLKQ